MSHVVWTNNVPHKLRYLSPWSPDGGAVWGCSGTFRRCSLVRGRTSLGHVLRIYSFTAVSVFSVFTVWLKMWSLSILLLLPCPLYYELSHWSQGQNKLFLPSVTFGHGVFIIVTKSNAYTSLLPWHKLQSLSGPMLWNQIPGPQTF